MSINARKSDRGSLVRVHDDFGVEFPQGSAVATECFLNLCRVALDSLSELSRLLDGFGVPSYTSFNALTVLAGAGEPIPPSVVARRMVATRPTVTGILETLERLGWITRRAHASDGRMRLVSLTDEGRELVQRVLPEVHRFEGELMSALSRDGQDALLACLAALAGRLESMRADR